MAHALTSGYTISYMTEKTYLGCKGGNLTCRVGGAYLKVPEMKPLHSYFGISSSNREYIHRSGYVFRTR